MAKVQHHPSLPSPASQTGENLPVRESEASRAVLQFNINPTESRAAVACTNFSAAPEQGVVLGTTFPSRLLAESAPISLVKQFQLPGILNIKQASRSSRATPLIRCGAEARATAEPAAMGALPNPGAPTGLVLSWLGAFGTHWGLSVFPSCIFAPLPSPWAEGWWPAGVGAAPVPQRDSR